MTVSVYTPYPKEETLWDHFKRSVFGEGFTAHWDRVERAETKFKISHCIGYLPRADTLDGAEKIIEKEKKRIRDMVRRDDFPFFITPPDGATVSLYQKPRIAKKKAGGKRK